MGSDDPVARSGERLRVVHVVPHFSPAAVGGAQRHVHDIASEMSIRHDVSVLTWTGNPSENGPPEEQCGAIRVIRLGQRETPLHSLETRCPEVEAQYSNAIRELRPDVAHIHQLAGLSTELVAISRGFARATVVTLHDYLAICPTCTIHWRGDVCYKPGARCYSCLRPDAFSRKRALGYWRLTNPVVVRWALAAGTRTAAGRFVASLAARKDLFFDALRGADRVIAPSKALAGVYAARGIDPGSISVAPHGILAPRTFAGRETHNPLRFGFIGSHRVKGLLMLLRVFEKIAAGSAELLAYTDLSRYEPGLRRRIAALAGRPGVRIMGSFEPAESDRCYESFDVLVAPSVWAEPFGLVAAEAIARGVPVIAADSSGFEETVRDGANGLLFRRGDERSLADAIGRCVSDAGYVRQLQRGCGCVKSTAEQALEIEGIYADCLKCAGARSQ